MQSCWNLLKNIHESLNLTRFHTIDPKSWHHVITQTLSSSSSTPDNKCHLSPETCQHCRQLMALSAVTTMGALLTRNKKGRSQGIAETYLQPLLDHKFLKCMVDLLRHHCLFLRYQSLKALTSLCSLPGLTESSAHYVAELCIQVVLQRSPGDALSLEPLQLLCCLLSSRTGCEHTTAVSALLLQYLPALYQQCCFPALRNSPEKVNSDALPAGSETSDKGAVLDDSMQTVSSSVRKRAYDDALGESLMDETGIKSLQEMCKCKTLSETEKESPGKSGCRKASEENQHSSSFLAETGSFGKPVGQISKEQVIDVHEQKPSNKTHSVLQNINPHSFESLLHLDRHSEPHTDTEENDSDSFSSSSHTSSCSHQNVLPHYMFLCLLQKLCKLFNLLPTSERVTQVQGLKGTLLDQLVKDHAVMFNNAHLQLASHHWLVERKFLDVLDTIIDYVQLRTSKKVECVYEEIAVYFVHCLQTTDCSWSFPCQSTLIGGRPDKQQDGEPLCRPSDDQTHRCEEEMLDSKENGDSNPVLVLLVAVVLKSCAIIFKTRGTQAGESKETTACVSLLRSMHQRLNQVFGAGPEGVNEKTGVDWLVCVCGEQDDRWTEALLCMLDIFVCLQSVGAPGSNMTTLMTLLNPHPLFVQLLELTHFNASLLIDWLTSPETCFLAYFTRYLRFLAADFATFRMVLSSLNPSVESGGSSFHRNGGREKMKPEKKCDVGGQETSTEAGSVSVVMHTSAQPSESTVVGEAVITSSSCSRLQEHSPSGLADSSIEHSPVAASSDIARDSSLGMALLSCYGSDDDESCEDESSLGGDSALEDAGDFVQAKDDFSDMSKSVDVCSSDAVVCIGTYGNQPRVRNGAKDNEMSMPLSLSLSQTQPEGTDKSLRSEQNTSARLTKPPTWQRGGGEEKRESICEDFVMSVDRVMCLLTDVREKLERLERGRLLVYNPAPLLHVLKKCEQQYNAQ